MTANLTLTYGSLNLTASPYLLEFGLDTGAPQNINEALAFLLQDGEIELSTRASNRTLTFNVLIEGSTLTALATAEADLIAETERALNTLTVDPGDGAPASVYEVFRGQVTFVRDDNFELGRMRRYTVTVRALPFVRSEDEVVTAATSSGSGSGTVTPTVTSVDTMASATNWTGAWERYDAGTVTSSLTATGTTLRVDATDKGRLHLWEERTGAVSLSGTPYIFIDWKWTTTGGRTLVSPGPMVTLNGQSVKTGTVYNPVLTGPSPTSGYTRSYFEVPAWTSIRFTIDISARATGPDVSPATFEVDQFSRADVLPSVGSTRQQVRALAVSGSARTRGAVAIEHTSDSLGDVIAYFWTDVGNGYSPSMRQFRTSGGTVTTDTSLVSGARENLVGATAVYAAPVTQFICGLHDVVVRLGGAATTATVTWTLTTVVNGVDTGPSVTGSRAVTITSAYQIFTLGREDLPTRYVPANSSAQVRLSLTATVSSGSTALLDEAWLFNAQAGQLVQASCGTAAPSAGGSSNRMFIRSATTAVPRPTILLGYAADESDAGFPLSVQAWQFPELVPPSTNVFTVTTNAQNAAVSLRHYPRWHTHAAS